VDYLIRMEDSSNYQLDQLLRCFAISSDVMLSYGKVRVKNKLLLTVPQSPGLSDHRPCYFIANQKSISVQVLEDIDVSTKSV
jgi:hypothetical protein